VAPRRRRHRGRRGERQVLHPNLKEVRLELAFIPSQFREETLNFTASIGGQQWRSPRPTPFNV
jgi:hypothetical protein